MGLGVLLIVSELIGGVIGISIGCALIALYWHIRCRAAVHELYRAERQQIEAERHEFNRRWGV